MLRGWEIHSRRAKYMIKRGLVMALIALGLLFLYLVAWPVSIAPTAWQPPLAPELDGPFAPNTALATTEKLGKGLGIGPEAVVFDSQGRLYTGYEGGKILRFDLEAGTHELFCNTEGRPLGMAFDGRGDLIVADAIKGLVAISPAGKMTVLSEEANGRRFKFTDDLDIADNGLIYFSDASDKFGPKDFLADLIEHRPNGRLLVYNPLDETTRVIVDQLYFANGVAVDPDQEFVLVTETGKFRVLRYWLVGERQGEVEVFMDNLPGYPDNITAGSEGVFWLALAYPRDPDLDWLMGKPFLRKVFMRLPSFLHPMPEKYSFVLGVDRDGAIVHNLQDPTGQYAPITSALEHEGKLYFGSIEMDAIGSIARP